MVSFQFIASIKSGIANNQPAKLTVRGSDHREETSSSSRLPDDDNGRRELASEAVAPSTNESRNVTQNTTQ